MTANFVHYDLQEGFVSNWLLGGPQTIPIPIDRIMRQDFETQIIHQYLQDDSRISAMPVERGPITDGVFKAGDYEGTWTYYRCRGDHFVDLSMKLNTVQYLRSWAYAQILSERAQDVTFNLTTYGPADFWLNGQHIHRQEYTGGRHPRTVFINAALREGSNEILIRFEAVALPDRRHALALQVSRTDKAKHPAAGVQVHLPTTIQQLDRREVLECAFYAAYLVQDVFERTDMIALHWPDDFKGSVEVMVRLQTPTGRIYAEASLEAKAGEQIILSQGYQVPGGPYHILVMPSSKEYYEDQVRIRRELPIWVLGRNAHSRTHYGDYDTRKQEALDSATQHKGEVFAEIAKMKLGLWDELNTDVLGKRIEDITQPGSNSLLDLVGLLGALYRFGDDPNFPGKLRGLIEACIMGFHYDGNEWYQAESPKTLIHTAEILAGQLYPDRTFSDSGETGQWHRKRGEQQTAGWLHALGTHGFVEWDSPDYFANAIIALSHLIDLAETEQIWEIASVVLDKALLTIALNSYQGVYGASQGRASISPAIGGLLAPTAGITRLMWGAGIFNHHIAGIVSMACLDNYETPDIFFEIALVLPDETWNRERHTLGAEEEVNKVTYRTPDYLLCSAQDYHPGDAGTREHIWQASFGPRAFVFANHPANSSTDGVCAPDFWTGNAALPRVAQWKDVLIAIHKLPDEDWMGFTHAYFPADAFDEYILRDRVHGLRWAFARLGAGYIALTASGGMSFIKHGHSAYRELRSDRLLGQNQIWICHMGRTAIDGPFEGFQEKILDLEVAFHKSSVQLETLRGETLSFGWDGPFQRDGMVQPLSGFNHYETPYCTAEMPCSQMEIRTENYLLRLNFDK